MVRFYLELLLLFVEVFIPEDLNLLESTVFVSWKSYRDSNLVDQVSNLLVKRSMSSLIYGLTFSNYTLDSVSLTHINSVNDLDIIFIPSFLFRDYCFRKVEKAFKILQFIIPVSRHLENISPIKLVHFASIRPHLRYYSLIWLRILRTFPLWLNVSSFSYTFFRFVFRKIGKPLSTTCHNFNPLLSQMQLTILGKRKIVIDLFFKLLNNIFVKYCSVWR